MRHEQKPTVFVPFKCLVSTALRKPKWFKKTLLNEKLHNNVKLNTYYKSSEKPRFDTEIAIL